MICWRSDRPRRSRVRHNERCCRRRIRGSALRALTNGVARHITVDPMVCHGQACVRGMRIPASVILDNLAAGVAHAEILASYPGLTEIAIRASLAYAADLAAERVLALPAWLASLRTAQGTPRSHRFRALQGRPESACRDRGRASRPTRASHFLRAGSSLGSRSAQVDVWAVVGKTAMVGESLCTSIPRSIIGRATAPLAGGAGTADGTC